MHPLFVFVTCLLRVLCLEGKALTVVEYPSISFAEANAFCNHITNGTGCLASIHSHVEFLNVSAAISRNYYSHYYWIGLQETHHNIFQWVDQSAWDYGTISQFGSRPWAIGQPPDDDDDAQCVAIQLGASHSDDQWVTQSCAGGNSDIRGVVCQWHCNEAALLATNTTVPPTNATMTQSPSAMDEDDQKTTENDGTNTQGDDNEQLEAVPSITDTLIAFGAFAVLLCATGILVVYIFCCRRLELVDRRPPTSGIERTARSWQPVASSSVNPGGFHMDRLIEGNRVIGPVAGSVSEHQTPAPPARSPPKENTILNMQKNNNQYAGDLDGVTQTNMQETD